jgi:signal transduction histidine kinase
LADPVLRAVVLHLADITDLADAQAQSALLSQALAHAPIGLAVLGWQAPLRPAIRHANGAFYARLGLEPDSGPPEALWAHLPRAVAQALAVGLLHGQPIDLALTARGRLRGASDTLMDGAHEPAQTEWQCTPLPVWDDPTKPTSANGPQPEAWLLVVRDVSERERYQAQQAQQTRLRQHAALAAQEAERSRIARDLHDGAGQWLSLLSLQLQQLPDTPLRAEIQQTLSTLAQDVRHAVRNLSPANLTQMPLGDALRQLGAQVSAAGMSADWHLPEPEPQWPPSLAIDLFRMVQELVSNSLRHSQATEVRLHLRLDEVHGQLSLIYEDNGQGMHWPIRAKSVTNAGGQGLRNLAYRAQLLGGWLRIESAPGQGFAAWLSMPLGAPSQ